MKQDKDTRKGVKEDKDTRTTEKKTPPGTRKGVVKDKGMQNR